MATMQRKKKDKTRTAAIIELPPEGGGSGETEEETEGGRSAQEQIDTVADSETQPAEALVYRIDQSTGREGYLDKVSAELISTEFLGKEYGGGKYRVQFRGPGEGGRMVYKKQQRYEVDPSIPPKPPRWARPATASSGEVRNADGTPAGETSIDKVLSTGILSLFTQQQENSRMQADWFRTMMDSRSKAPGIVEILAAVTPILAIVKELFTANRGAPAAPAKDPIELAKELLEITGGKAPSEKSAVAQLKEVLELREMLAGLGGGESEEDPMVKLVGLLGPKIIDAIQNAQQIDANRSGRPAAPATTTARATALPPTPERAATAATPAAEIPTGKAGSESRAAAPPPAQGEAPTMDMAMAYINSRLEKITKLAKADKSPDLYAMLEEDILPEAFKPAAREFVSQPNFIDQIFEAHPHLNEWHDWFEDFFETFRDALLGQLEDDDEEGGETGAEEERAGDATDGAGSSLPNNGEVVRADIPADSPTTQGSRNGTVE